MQNGIYFDSAATTQISKKALEEYNRISLEVFANPSSSHIFGKNAKSELEKARINICETLSVEDKTLYFTSGATESISIVLSSLLFMTKGNIITSSAEHDAVMSFMPSYLSKGWTWTELKTKNGFVTKEDLEEKITNETRIVAIQAVNNIIGSINPIEDLVKVVRAKEAEFGKKIFFFCDAVQAIGKVPFSFLKSDVDGASISAHKIHGPKGVGLLYLKRDNLMVISRGGGQEKGIRGGTENLPAISAFSIAMKEKIDDEFNIKELNDTLRNALRQNDYIKVLTPEENSSPYILTFSSPIPSEVMMRMLQDKGFYVSSGSACSNNLKKKSESVFQKMGFSPKEAQGAIRVSFSHNNTINEVEAISQAIISLVKEFTHG